MGRGGGGRNVKVLTRYATLDIVPVMYTADTVNVHSRHGMKLWTSSFWVCNLIYCLSFLCTTLNTVSMRNATSMFFCPEKAYVALRKLVTWEIVSAGLKLDILCRWGKSCGYCLTTKMTFKFCNVEICHYWTRYFLVLYVIMEFRYFLSEIL